MLLQFQYLALIMFREFWGLTNDLAKLSELGGGIKKREGNISLPRYKLANFYITEAN